MNALAQIDQPISLGDIDSFAECCRYQAWFVTRGWITKQVAVDNLQWLATLWLLPDQHGDDAVQGIMAAEFAPRGPDVRG